MFVWGTLLDHETCFKELNATEFKYLADVFLPIVLQNSSQVVRGVSFSWIVRLLLEVGVWSKADYLHLPGAITVCQWLHQLEKS